jgi:hypothetical protein
MTARALQGQTALVTGAAKRIGRAIALTLADEGVNVVLHYNSSVEEAKVLARELAQRGTKTWLMQANFEKPIEYESLVQRVLDNAGSLDILVNSASIYFEETLDQVSFASLTRNVEVNAWAPFALGRDFARLVGRGKIVNLLDSRVGDYD